MDEAVATADALARDALRHRPPGTVATVLLSPAAASFDMFEDYAARGRAFIAAVGRLAEATMSTTPLTAVRRTPRNAVPRTAPRTQITLQRERHEPEYGILVAIVALAAIGILMVYSSSAMKAFLQRDDTFAIVGPQIQWAALGMVAMVVMMRIDYRWLRVASVPAVRHRRSSA